MRRPRRGGCGGAGRADALVEVCRRAAAAGGSAPATPKAAVVVTMDHQDLANRTGAGTTMTGQLLAPETVRRMACDALCPRHHTIVHQRGHTATVTAATVTWHL
jgi:hypothetical protein